jgi:hypothetical protein
LGRKAIGKIKPTHFESLPVFYTWFKRALKGSKGPVVAVYDPNLPPGRYGVTRESDGGFSIRIGRDAMQSEEELANTIAHELNHIRGYLANGIASSEETAEAAAQLALKYFRWLMDVLFSSLTKERFDEMSRELRAAIERGDIDSEAWNDFEIHTLRTAYGTRYMIKIKDYLSKYPFIAQLKDKFSWLQKVWVTVLGTFT